MKKTTRSFLLAILLLCTIFAMTIMVSATGEDSTTDTGSTTVEVLQKGWVKMLDGDGNTFVGTEGEDLWFEITKEGEEVVLTITGTEKTLNFNTGARYGNFSATTVPWYDNRTTITKVVIEAPITAIDQSCAFNEFSACHTMIFPDTIISLKGSMIFAGMSALTKLGLENTPENTIDLRNFRPTGTSTASQPFDDSCKTSTADNPITVFMPYTASTPMNTTKVFSNDTVVTFVIVPDSACATTVATIKDHADNWETYTTENSNVKPHTMNVTVKTYDEYFAANPTGLVIENQTSDGHAKWSFNVDSGDFNVTCLVSGWSEFKTADSVFQSFKSRWGYLIKNATIAKFGKISSPLFADMTNLQTVRFSENQRLQNGDTSVGFFTNCTNLSSIVFGTGEFTTGLADFSGVDVTSGQDSESNWLNNTFKNCENITDVILPTKPALTTVHSTTFTGCSSLKNVTIGSNITTIPTDTFNGLGPITIHADSRDSAAALFVADEGNVTVITPAVATSGQIDGVEGDGDNDLTWDFNAESGTLTIAGESTAIVWPADAFIGYNTETSKVELEDLPWYNYMSAIENLVVDAPLTELVSYAFGGLTNLKTVIFPAELVKLAPNAFDDADSLVSVKTKGVEAPDNVIDLRNITTSSYQVFEKAFDNVTPTIWLGKDGSAIGNNNFAMDCAGVKFVVYPGSVGEDVVYNMINNPATTNGNSVICPNITYSYYTTNEDADLATWTDLLTGSQTADYGIATWTLDIDTGIVTVTVAKGTKGLADCTIKNTDWQTFLSTFKYVIKEIHLPNLKLEAGSTINGLPELTTIIFNGTRMQGDTTFKNNPKLTTLGTSDNVVDGVINLSGWNEVNNSHTHSALYKGMFEGCTSITKVILPANFSASANFGIISIGANAFKGCTGLKEIVIPDGCSILMTDVTCSKTAHTGNVYNGTIDSTAFDGCGTIAVICEDADFDIDTFMALHDGFYLISNSADGLTKGVVFDGWQVRLNSYTNSKGLKVTNGLRGVFYFDNDIIDANTNWTLVEYGALLSTAANKASAVVSYDKTTGEVTSDCKWKFAIGNADGVNGKVLSKSAVAKIEDADPNDTYFVVSVVNYTNNYRTDIYMTGYEVWVNKETGAVVISYSDYSNEKYVDTNIYEISLNMYKNGFVNANNDKENIVWDTLVNGGALELTKDVDYVTKDEYCVDADGNPIEVTNMLDGKPFGDSDTFTVANVPMVRQWTENVTNDQGTADTSDDVTVKTLKFAHAGTTYTFLHDPDNEGKYIIVYRDDPDVAGTEIPKTAPWVDGYHSQIETSWYPGNTGKGIKAVQADRPNPKYTTNIYSSANYAIIDYGVTGTEGESFKGSGVNTYMYNETFTKLGSCSFQGTGAITTMFPAGTTPVTGRIEISSLTTVGSGYVFNGSKNIVELHLPTNITIGRQFAQNAASLTTVWLGGENIDINEDGEIGVNEWTTREEGVINLSNAENEAFTKIGDKDNTDEYSFSKVKATELWLPASVQEIMSSSFTDSSLETIYHYGISEPVEAIQSYATSNGYEYWWDGAIESAVGYSGIIVD